MKVFKKNIATLLHLKEYKDVFFVYLIKYQVGVFIFELLQNFSLLWMPIFLDSKWNSVLPWLVFIFFNIFSCMLWTFFLENVILSKIVG